jgi:hypothetical protein
VFGHPGNQTLAFVEALGTGQATNPRCMTFTRIITLLVGARGGSMRFWPVSVAIAVVLSLVAHIA